MGYWNEDFVKVWTPVMKDFEEFQVKIGKLEITPKDITLLRGGDESVVS